MSCDIRRFRSNGQLGCETHESVDLWVFEDAEGKQTIRCKIGCEE